MSRRRVFPAGALAAGLCALLAAAPSPVPSPYRINVENLQPRSLLPTVPLHTEFVVQTNKLGQVVKVVNGKISKSKSFNGQTYGNSLQAFIRTADGKAVPGTYRLTYDYNPKTARVRRDVQLMKAGGVNPNAVGAATRMEEIARRQRPLPAAPKAAAPPPPNAAATLNPKTMPDLPQVMKTAAP